MKKLLMLLVLAVVAGCAGRPTPIPDADTPDARLYSARCAPCHRVPHPGRHTYEQWEHLLGVMEARMEHKRMTPMTPEEKSAILGYLKRNSR